MENKFNIDYLTFTIKIDNYYEWGYGYQANMVIEKFIEKLTLWSDGYITLDKFIEKMYGRNHFDTMYKWADRDYFTLCASQRNEGMKNMVQCTLSGQGIQELGTEIVYTILRRSYEMGCSVTRLDICYDDYNKIMPVTKLLKTFEKYIMGKKLITSNYKADTANIYMGAWNDVPYRNLTFGSRTASQYFRLYDKRAEQKTLEYDYWLRMELELRRETAQACTDYIVKNWPDIQTCFRYFLNRMFRVLEREPKNDNELHNINRMKTAEWWLKFVETEEKAKVVYTKPNVNRTIDDMIGHIEKNYAPYIKTLIDIAPERFEKILRTKGAEGQMKPKYKRLLSHYKSEQEQVEKAEIRQKYGFPDDIPLTIVDKDVEWLEFGEYYQ